MAAFLNLLAIFLAGAARLALAQVDGIEGAPGCWFVIDIAEYKSCSELCTGFGGTCDKDAMIHTGSPVGQHLWPDAPLSGTWAIVECLTSSGVLWGANGKDWSGASDTCGYKSGQCTFPCACTLDECALPATAEPTTEPTAAPTTAMPTASPTEEPTPAPTTAMPTAAPTEAPTPMPTAAPTAAPTEEGFYWVTDVCGRENFASRVQSQHESAAVRCCDLSGESAKTPRPCQVGTYHEAAETCASINMTLCNSSNVYLACGSGCNHNHKLVWTQSSAAPETPTSENLLFAGEFETVVGDDEEAFLAECTNQLSHFAPVSCVAVEEGSILVTVGSQNRTALDEAIRGIVDNGMDLPSYRPLYLILDGDADAAETRGAILPFGLLLLALVAPIVVVG